ncbi:unnamed protein product, partial [Closterium sp. NIES-53]
RRDYELQSLGFSTAFLQGNLHKEIWLRRPPGFTGSFPDDPALPPFYNLVYVYDFVFPTADSEALSFVKVELLKRHTYTDLVVRRDLRWGYGCAGVTLANLLLTDLREQPRSAPILYANNKAMFALCQEQRLESKTKHIGLRYFLVGE